MMSGIVVQYSLALLHTRKSGNQEIRKLLKNAQVEYTASYLIIYLQRAYLEILPTQRVPPVNEAEYGQRDWPGTRKITQGDIQTVRYDTLA
jgi:hypothetical protein